MPSENSTIYYPYRFAKLVDYNPSATKKWYIDFQAYHVQEGKLKRKRIYIINNIKDIKKRRLYALQLIAEINDKLRKGYHFDETKKAKEKEIKILKENYDFINAQDALKESLKILHATLTHASNNSYRNIVVLFLQFLKKQGKLYDSIKIIDKKTAISYVDELLIYNKLSGKTINARVSVLKSIWNKLLDREVVNTNIWIGIKKIKEIATRKNMAYTPELIEKIKRHLLKNDVRLWNYCQLIFYSFIRPNEIRQLKIKHIDHLNKTIYVPAQVSKTKRERYVYINDSLHNVLNYFIKGRLDKEEYLIMLNNNRKNKMIGISTFSNDYRKMKRDLGIPIEYNMYSWKHTGNVMAYKAGVDIYTIMRQNGHSSIDTTMIYLRSLGIIMHKDLMLKMNNFKI